MPSDVDRTWVWCGEAVNYNMTTRKPPKSGINGFSLPYTRCSNMASSRVTLQEWRNYTLTDEQSPPVQSRRLNWLFRLFSTNVYSISYYYARSRSVFSNLDFKLSPCSECSFFLVTPQRMNFVPTFRNAVCSETSEHKIQTPGSHQKERIQHI